MKLKAMATALITKHINNAISGINSKAFNNKLRPKLMKPVAAKAFLRSPVEVMNAMKEGTTISNRIHTPNQPPISSLFTPDMKPTMPVPFVTNVKLYTILFESKD